MPERLRDLALKGALLLVIALSATAGTAGIAQAATSHPFLGALDGGETPAGEFGYACGVSVDSEGYLYVTSYEASSIEVFNPAHEYVTSAPDPEAPCLSAVDSEGNLYVQGFGGATPSVQLLEPDSYPPTSATAYAPTKIFEGGSNHVNSGAQAVAVNPSNDHLLIAERETIAEYKSAAEGSQLLSDSIAKDLAAAGVPLSSVAVDGKTGSLYVVGKTGSGAGAPVIAVMNPSGTEVLSEITGAGSPSGEIGVGEYGTPMSVDRATGNIFVSQVDVAGKPNEVYEFAPDGEFVSAIGPTFGASLSFIDSQPSGLAVDNSTSPTAGNVYVGSGELDAVVYEFGPSPLFPLSVTKAGTGSGTVTSSPAGINCASICNAKFEEGKVVSLSASPASGSAFGGWSGACTGTGACEVAMSEAKAVTATFNAQGNGDGGGTTSPPPASCATNTSLCPPSTATAASKAQVKAGKAVLLISCPGPGACQGTLTLTAKITTGKGKQKKTKAKTIGSASFSLKGGESTTVSLKLSGAAKSALARAGKLKATLKGAGLQGGGLTLEAPKANKKGAH